VENPLSSAPNCRDHRCQPRIGPRAAEAFSAAEPRFCLRLPGDPTALEDLAAPLRDSAKPIAVARRNLACPTCQVRHQARVLVRLPDHPATDRTDPLAELETEFSATWEKRRETHPLWLSTALTTGADSALAAE